jgi:hypothetical protein
MATWTPQQATAFYFKRQSTYGKFLLSNLKAALRSATEIRDTAEHRQTAAKVSRSAPTHRLPMLDRKKSHTFPSDRDALDNIPRYFLLPPIVKPGGARVRVASQALDVFKRNALLEQVRRCLRSFTPLCSESLWFREAGE